MVRVKHHQEFRTIEVFQKHENSIAITDNESHCDVLDWQHYYSSWKPVRTLSSNKKFKALKYSKKDEGKFVDIDIEALKEQRGAMAIDAEQLAVLRARMLCVRNDKSGAEKIMEEEVSLRDSASLEDNLDKMKAFHELGQKEKSLAILARP